MKIKICGITNLEDAQDAVSLGVDAIGFIFFPESPRYITPEKAEEISLFLPPFIQVVGVFVNQNKEDVCKIAEQCKLDLIQLHGEATPGYCINMPSRIIKSFRVAQLEDIEPIAKYQGVVSAICLDTKVDNLPGGTGKSFDWGLALKAKEYDIPIILSGGININNVKKAVKLVNPYAIDVSTGVEIEPGKKDYNKMKELITVIKVL